MASIVPKYKNKAGQWVYYIVDKEHGRIIYSRSSGYTVERLANKKLREYEENKERGLTEITLSKFIDIFVKNSTGRAKRSLQTYKGIETI